MGSFRRVGRTAGVDMGQGVETVLLVDDHQLVAQLLSSTLAAEPDLECVGVAHDASSAVRQARALTPDIVLMDVRLGDGDGIAVARELLADLPRTRVIVLTAFADTRLVQRAVEAGVSGLVAKDGQIEALLELVRRSVRGSFVHGDGIPAPRRQEDRLAAAGLDPRAGEVLRLLAAGLGVQEMARELGTDEATVHQQVAVVLTALGVDTPHAAVSAAVERGLLRVGGR